MSELDRFRLSFESVADVYERSRPRYAPDAVAWLAQRLDLRRVLDLAAGTGKLTRQLLELGANVVAVEPGDEMRAVFARALPGVPLHAGSAEAIPLDDGSVDAIAVGQAFHWFRAEAALPEMHRVLRPGGGVALLWNDWDDDDPLLHALNELVDALRPPGTGERRPREAMEGSSLFHDPEERVFRHAEQLPAHLVVERVSSVSVLAAAAPADRERALAEVRRLVGAGTVEFRMLTTVFVADRA